MSQIQEERVFPVLLDEADGPFGVAPCERGLIDRGLNDGPGGVTVQSQRGNSWRACWALNGSTPSQIIGEDDHDVGEGVG